MKTLNKPNGKVLTMGLSGNLGSVITKFFSMRSRVVARSIPFLISFCLALSSKLSGLSSSLSASGSSTMVPSSSSFSERKLPFSTSLMTSSNIVATEVSRIEQSHVTKYLYCQNIEATEVSRIIYKLKFICEEQLSK